MCTSSLDCHKSVRTGLFALWSLLHSVLTLVTKGSDLQIKACNVISVVYLHVNNNGLHVLYLYFLYLQYQSAYLERKPL